MSLLRMSVTGGALIAVVALIRAFGLNRLPKRLFPALWCVVLVRLLLPVSVPVPAELIPAVSPVIITEPSDVRPVSPAPGGLLPALPSAPDPAPSSPEAEVSPVEVTGPADSAGQGEPEGRDALPDLPLLPTVWAAVGLALGAYFAVSWLRFRRELRTSLPARCEFAERWLYRHRLKRRVELRCLTGLPSPMTYGVLRPKILVPTDFDWSDTDSARYMLYHEFTHIRRFDAARKVAAAAALCVHWFNPLVWLMYVLMNRDIELACDEQVLRHFGPGRRRSYAMTLIGMEEKRVLAAPFGSFFNKNAAEERIGAIMKFNKKSVIALILAVVLSALGAVTVFAVRSDAPGSKSGSADLEEAEAWFEEQDPEYDILSGEVHGDTAVVLAGRTEPEADNYKDLSIFLLKRSGDTYAVDAVKDCGGASQGVRARVLVKDGLTVLFGDISGSIGDSAEGGVAAQFNRINILLAGGGSLGRGIGGSGPYLLVFEDELDISDVEFVGPELSVRYSDLGGDLMDDAREYSTPGGELEDVLGGKAGFIYVSEVGQTSATLEDLTEIFPGDPGIGVFRYALLDLEGDGGPELVLHVVGAAGDLGGLLILHRMDGQIYGYKVDSRTLTNLKADGTGEFSTQASSYEAGICSVIGFTGTGITLDKFTLGRGSYETWETLIVDGEPADEARYLAALEAQAAKPDAPWVSFTPAPETESGEARVFELNGLKLRVTNVLSARKESVSGEDGLGEFYHDVYELAPGAVMTVLEAGTTSGRPEWALDTTAGRVDIVDGMDPVELTADILGVYDPESSMYVLTFTQNESREGGVFNSLDWVEGPELDYDSHWAFFLEEDTEADASLYPGGVASRLTAREKATGETIYLTEPMALSLPEVRFAVLHGVLGRDGFAFSCSTDGADNEGLVFSVDEDEIHLIVSCYGELFTGDSDGDGTVELLCIHGSDGAAGSLYDLEGGRVTVREYRDGGGALAPAEPSATTLSYYVDGEDEAVPASRFSGGGFDITVPDQGWPFSTESYGGYTSYVWRDAEDGKSTLRIVDFSGVSFPEARELIRAQEPEFGLIEDKQGGLTGEQRDGDIRVVFYGQGSLSAYAVICTWPANVSHRTAAQLRAMADSVSTRVLSSQSESDRYLDNLSALTDSELFAFFLRSDGAYAEGAASEMGLRFIADPASLLASLAQVEDDSERSLLAENIGYEVYYRDASSSIYNSYAIDPLTAGELSALREIEAGYDRIRG